MTSKTLDFTSWYELQADTDSDDEFASRGQPRSHKSYSHLTAESSHFEPLQPYHTVSHHRQQRQPSLIQQLLDEMDDANQKIDQYSTSKSKNEGMSLEEFPIGSQNDASGCDEVLTTAIAEVSKDFITGKLTTGPPASGESDESHLSSDNDFRLLRGAAYAKYPETAAGLSDNDWNPYVTESDTNTSPRVAGELRPASLMIGGGGASIVVNAADSKVNSLLSSFNPPLCSTKTGSAGRSKTSFPLTEPRSSAQQGDSSLHLSDIKEGLELSLRSVGSLKPDASLSPPQLTSSKLSEYSFGARSLGEEAPDSSSNNIQHSSSQSREEAARSLRRCFERTSWPPGSPDKVMVGGSSSSTKVNALGGTGTAKTLHHKADSGIDYSEVEESFKRLGSFGDGMRERSWEIKSSLPGRGYFSDAVQSALCGSGGDWKEGKRAGDQKGDLALGRGSARPLSSSRSAVSVDSEKPAGDALLRDSGGTRLSRDSAAGTSTSSSSAETVVPASFAYCSKPNAAIGATFDPKHHERLSQQVNKLLQETAYLTGSSRVKDGRERMRGAGAEGATGPGMGGEKPASTSLDYDRLHRDLQEIQDSLHTMGQSPANAPKSSSSALTLTQAHPALSSQAQAAGGGSKSDSDEADIVPSTSTTPERGRRLMWDYAADLGYGRGDLNQLEGMMSDVTAESSPLDPAHRPASPSTKLHYTSDGEETRTSSLGHGEEEEHVEDSNLTLTNQLQQAAATAGNALDLEELISTFRTESRALENRYQAVCSQGMADKVMSILTSSNPDQQAQGILSQISDEERQHRNNPITSSHRGGGIPASLLESSFSDSSPDSKTLSLLAMQSKDDCVRKRLDLSLLSESLDNSCLLDGQHPKLEAAFSAATSAAQSLISEQMKKMAERTFSQSLELRTPVRQEVQCYPVYSSQRDTPHHQRLQQQLQDALKQQQSQGRGQTLPKEAWVEKESADDKQKSQGAEATEKKFMSMSVEEKEKTSGPTGDSPPSPASPSGSDKSSEMHHGKYRPYRPAGSQDVYYTESDTASVAESVTTVESTHTGSDDAVGPHFPSTALGSRHDVTKADSGIYAKKTKSAPAFSSGQDAGLPTIQERVTPESRDPFTSDSSESRVKGAEDDGKRKGHATSHIPVRTPTALSSGSQNRSLHLGGGDISVSEVMAKQQARVEDIVREKDMARKVPTSDAGGARLPEAPAPEKSCDRETGLTGEASQRTQPPQEPTAPLLSPTGHARSRIPVRGPPPNYQTALQEKQQDWEAGLQGDQNKSSHNVHAESTFGIGPIRSTMEKQETLPATADVQSGGEAQLQLLKAIDEQVQSEILEKHRSASSAESSDDASQKLQGPSVSTVDGKKDAGADDLLRERSRDRVDAGPGEAAGLETNRLLGDLARDRERRWREAEAVVQRAQGGLEVDDGLADKRREEGALLRQHTSHRRPDFGHALLDQHPVGEVQLPERPIATSGLSTVASRQPALVGFEASSHRQEIPVGRDSVVSQSFSQRLQTDLELGEAVTDKRREEAELQRQRQEEEAARQRQAQQTEQLNHELDRREAEARQKAALETEAAATREAELQEEIVQRRVARREAEAEIERKARQLQEAEAQLRREAEQRQLEANRLRQEERLREEELRREEAQLCREADLRRKAEMRQEAELRKEAELQQREADLRREAEIQREALQRREAELQQRQAELQRAGAEGRYTEVNVLSAAERQESAGRQRREAAERALKQEMQLAREMAERRRQQEAEEAILRAGGGTGDGETDSQQAQELPLDVQEALDRQPLSHKAQLLRHALEKEPSYQGGPDLHILWERYLAGSGGSGGGGGSEGGGGRGGDGEPDSSLNSETVARLSELMADPTQHLVSTFLAQRQEQGRRERARAAAHREAVKQREADERRVGQEELAALERELRRQKARQQQHRLSSEEESNGSYGEILQQRERDRLRRREIRTQRKKGKSPSPSPSPARLASQLNRSAAAGSLSPSRVQTNGKEGGMETLYSIPEDTTHDMTTPQKSRSPHRSRSQQSQRQADVIDPYMDKLRQRISQQREKMGQERVKELRRRQKLDKLKALLRAKSCGLIDDSAVAAHLASISSTSAPSDEDSATLLSQLSVLGSLASDDTTTAKDSSTEMRRAKLARSSPDYSSRAPSRSLNRERQFELAQGNVTVSSDTDEFTQLLEDSSSQTETDLSVHQSRRRYRGFQASPTPSKRGRKMAKLHQTYSPYSRQEMGLHPRIWPKEKERKLQAARSPHAKTRELGTMFPSPKQRTAAHGHAVDSRRRAPRLVSQAVQTSPDPRSIQQRSRSFSPPPIPSQHRKDQQAAWSKSRSRGQHRRSRHTSSRQPTSSSPPIRQPSSPSRLSASSPSPQNRGVAMVRFPGQSRSISPAFDSRQVAACLSPNRSRPRSASPPRTQQHRRSPSPGPRRSPSPSELRLNAWLEREARSPLRDQQLGHRSPSGQRAQQPWGQDRRVARDYDAENRPPAWRQQRKRSPQPQPGLTWFIPMKDPESTKPWRRPLKECQDWAEQRQPRQHQQRRPNHRHQIGDENAGNDFSTVALSQRQWRELARADLEGVKGGLRGSAEGDAARLYLHCVTKEAEQELGQQYDKFDHKPLHRMTLQEALMTRRPEFISSLRQRQKRLQLAAENRQLQALVLAEQDRLFADQRRLNANPDAHPYSDNLYHPKRRVFSKQEMKELTEKKYKKLPEVKEREVEKSRSEEYRMNRLRAKVFNKRVQRKVLDQRVLRCR